MLVSKYIMTSSNGNIFRVTGPLAGNSPVNGEFPSQRPVTRSFGVCFDLCPNKRLSKQSWGWWFETHSHPLWRHTNDEKHLLFVWVGVVAFWCAILIAHQIVVAKHWGSCVHFSGISTCGRTSRETVSHSQRQPLPTPHKIALSVYVTVTNKRLQPLTTTFVVDN